MEKSILQRLWSPNSNLGNARLGRHVLTCIGVFHTHAILTSLYRHVNPTFSDLIGGRLYSYILTNTDGVLSKQRALRKTYEAFMTDQI